MDVASFLRVLPALVLAWLAVFFGLTLRRGRVPLIELIARVGDPGLTPELRTYERRLTAVWVGYFVAAATIILISGAKPGLAGACVWLGTVVLFVGEHTVRPLLFPASTFPGLVQQVRDTWKVWRPGPRG